MPTIQLSAQIEKSVKDDLRKVCRRTHRSQSYYTGKALGERLVLPDNMRAKQWGAMASLDPRQHLSGSSMSKKPLSKAGNRYCGSLSICPLSAPLAMTP